MKKQKKPCPGEHQNQANSATAYNLRELLEPEVNKYGKERVISELTKAAEKGVATMQRVLGALYDVGIIVDQNSKTAARWYMKAARQGYANGQFALGCAYYMGRGVKQNKSKAVYWFKKAAIQGHTGAQCRLCKMYRSGDGVAQSMLNAFNWYESKKLAKLKQQKK